MLVMGVDPGSVNIALAMREGKKLSYRNIEPEGVKKRGSRAEERLWPLATKFAEALKEIGPDYVYIEAPVYSGSFTATVALSMITGAMVIILQQLGIPYSFVGNNVWKKGLCGRGNATKEEVRAWVTTRFKLPKDGLVQDIIDAIGIAEWGAQKFRGGD